MIMVGVAVTTVSGCVAVDPGTAPVPRPETRTPAARPEVEPQIVQAPAREVLDAVLPVPERKAAPSASPDAGRIARPQPDSRAVHRPEAPPAKPKPRERPVERQRALPTTAPPFIREVCALGETYGGWSEDSPQARICHDAYGN
ncbi:hypothetical protein ACIO1C_13545 [Streptomyces sp. NPDC087420]|uniref:hypothetical protein n=1 Tax=Streptomyces sp. NPDC087420 TaxID=3365785 RepID=UPI0038326D60